MFWTILNDPERFWAILNDLERSWAILGDLKRSWAILGDLERSWAILSHPEFEWKPKIGHGLPRYESRPLATTLLPLHQGHRFIVKQSKSWKATTFLGGLRHEEGGPECYCTGAFYVVLCGTWCTSARGIAVPAFVLFVSLKTRWNIKDSLSDPGGS